MTDDDAVSRAMARLDAREDPPPPPELPPPPPEVVRVVQDLRLTVTAHERGGQGRLSWEVTDAQGRKVDARAGLADLFTSAARLIVLSGDWPQPLWRAARNVMGAMQEIAKMAPPAPVEH